MSQAGSLLSGGSIGPTVPIIFQTDSGTAEAENNILRVLGGEGIATTASGNLVTITNIATLTGNDVQPQSLENDNFNILTNNANVIFSSNPMFPGTLILDFGLTENLLLGSDGLGIALADKNVGIGKGSLEVIGNATRNVAVGHNSCNLIVDSSNCVAVGVNTLASLNSGVGENTALGESCLSSLLSGEDNIAIGSRSGVNFAGDESNNIVIGNQGDLGDDGAIRIGTNFVHTKAFVQGISGVDVAGSEPVGVNGVGQLSGFGFGDAGQVLTSGGDGVSPSWVAATTGLTTLTGNAGVATASAGNINVTTDNSTFLFSGSGAALTLGFSNASSNFAIGTSLPAIAGGVGNIVYGGLGAGSNLTTGSTNVIIGAQAGAALTEGLQSILIGTGAGQNLVDAGCNVAVGHLSLNSMNASTVGGIDLNVAVGWNSLYSLLSGYKNIAIGGQAGSNFLSSESENICIGNVGVTGDSNVTRLGFAQTKAYIAGTNVAPALNSGVLLVSDDNQITSAGQGTAGQVLTSNGSGVTPTWQAGGGGGGMLTITGNDGVAVPPDVGGNTDVITANTTVKFVSGIANTLALDFGYNNLAIGSSMNSVTTGVHNVGLGNAILSAVTTGFGNVCIGERSAPILSSGDGNVIIGYDSSTTMTSGGANVVIGSESGWALTTALQNVLIGRRAGFQITSGNDNVIIGNGAGNLNQGGSQKNIYLANPGVAPIESNTIRIGTKDVTLGPHTQAFMCGITGVAVGASAPVGIDANDQLSSLGFGTAGQVLTSNGSLVSPTWQAAISTAPKLYARVSPISVDNATGDGTIVTILFDTIVYQTGGSNYNAATGIYTVPSDGLYQISAVVSWSNLTAASTRSSVNINCSSGLFTISEANAGVVRSSTNNAYSQPASISAYFTAGQTIKIDGFVAGGTKTVGYYGNYFGQWSYLNIVKL